MGLNPKGDGQPLGGGSDGWLLIDLIKSDDYLVKVKL